MMKAINPLWIPKWIFHVDCTDLVEFEVAKLCGKQAHGQLATAESRVERIKA